MKNLSDKTLSLAVMALALIISANSAPTFAADKKKKSKPAPPPKAEVKPAPSKPDVASSALHAFLQRISPFKDQISGLSFPEERFDIQWEGSGDKLKAFVTLKGKFDKTDSALTIEKTVVKEDTVPAQSFEYKLEINQDPVLIEITAIDTKGDTSKETVMLRSERWAEIQSRLLKAHEGSEDGKSLVLTPSAGLTYISYSETSVSDLSEFGLTLKFNASRRLNQNWDLGANAYFTALPFLMSGLGTNIRFLGVNLRTGYRLPFVKAPWSISVMMGLYYTTTFSPGNFIGFKNMMGPQLFPTVRRAFGDSAVMGYFKYSPVSDSIPFRFSSSEFALGGGYSFKLKNRHTMSFNLDLAIISVNIDDLLFMTSRSLSLSAGYDF